MQHINKLKVLNFGPIKAGYGENNGFMEINQVSVFCGTQGSGKSTVAKLYSTFVWLEKALMRGDVTEKYVSYPERFKNKYLSYQGIHNYVKNDSYLHYCGLCYDFIYSEGEFTIVSHKDDLDYERPQIMYIPAERNLLSVIDKASSIKGMPAALSTMLDEYRRACKSLSGDLVLPINDVSFRYDNLNQIGNIVSSDYKVRISEASSGIQSVSPMYITLNYLYESVLLGLHAENNKSNAEEQALIDKRIHELLLDNTLDEETRATLIKKLSNNKNSHLINIIEEPEQNLFPDSQERILYNLIKLSATGRNQLLFTTHSPYILNYLSLSIKAHDIYEKINDKVYGDEIEQIVPSSACISGDCVSVYQMDLDGTIHKLPTYENMPSDENYLNTMMMETNIKFSQLMEIESRYE